MPTPQLSRIEIEGFKSLRSIDLELGPVTVLIGANGSGKSNFVEAFSFLRAIRQGRLREYAVRAGGADALLYFGARVTESLTLRARFQRGEQFENQYEITLKPAPPDRLVPEHETVFFWDKIRYPERPHDEGLDPIGEEAGISRPVYSRVTEHTAAYLDACRVYHFGDTGDLSPMSKMADLHDNRFMRTDGSNLAAFLYLLQSAYRDSYDAIVHAVQQVAPFFVDFDLAPMELNREKIDLRWRHAGSDGYWNVASLSSGTLRFIALATLFLQPERFRPSVIIVDEPELGLHPYAITLLASLIERASVDTQVIVSTQSSLLLDHFTPEDVVVAERVAGCTEFTHLDAAQLDSWLERYSMGQLWEKNILGGRPKPEALE